MMISCPCVIFSNWNWLVCSSSILNVYTIWAVRGFLFPVNVCVEWCCRILYLLKSVLLWSFPLGLYTWLKTVANNVSDTHNLKILSVFIVLVLFFWVHFPFLRVKEKWNLNIWLWAGFYSFTWFSLYSICKFKNIYALKSKAFIFVSEQGRYLRTAPWSQKYLSCC